MIKQALRLARPVILIAAAGCTNPPPPVETANVIALRDRAKACQRFEGMFQDEDNTTQPEAVMRLRGADAYRCYYMQREAVHLMRDPAANPSGDQRTTQFLEGLGFPNGRD